VEENKPLNATEIYRASIDGFSGTNLFSKVSGKRNCFVVIQSENDHRFGGYWSVPFVNG